jgi:acetyl-CoA carboxylase carboxyltransferase component
VPVLGSSVDPRSEVFAANRADMAGLLHVIDGLLAEAGAGGGERATGRMRSRGRLPVRERVALLLDRDSPWLELSPLAGNQTDYAVGGGMVLGIGVISGTECIVVGNDPTVLGGALTAVSIRKVERALQVARERRW